MQAKINGREQNRKEATFALSQVAIIELHRLAEFAKALAKNAYMINAEHIAQAFVGSNAEKERRWTPA